MLHEFLTINREELILRCRKKVSLRSSALVNRRELEYGIPLFLDQLTQTLQFDASKNIGESSRVADPSLGAQHSANTEIGIAALKHGTELLQKGFSIGQVVHDYGDLCQAVTELALEKQALIGVDEFHTLNRCLDNAIADAVTAYSAGVKTQEHETTNERLGFLAHELRNLLHSVVIALNVIRKGGVGFAGATATVLDRNLAGISNLIDRSLAEVRLEADLPPLRESIAVDEFIQQSVIIAELEAQARSIQFTVFPVEYGVVVEADRQMLAAALSNLLQNAFKFSSAHGQVSLSAYATNDRVLIDIQDECGGLQPGMAAEIIKPFQQHSTNRTGLGLGLSITRRSVEANGGKLKVRDLPGKGCVFTIDLPRQRRSTELPFPRIH